MNIADYAEAITTPAFWIASAIGSIALSVAGNLVTPKIAAVISNQGFNRRQQQQKKKARFLGEAVILITKPEKILHTKIDSIHAFLVACVFMLLALTMFTAATALEWLIVPVIVRLVIVMIAIPIVWLSLFLTKEGMRRRSIAICAQQYLNEQEKLEEKHGSDRATILGLMDEWLFKNHGMRLDDIKSTLSQEDPQSSLVELSKSA